MHGKWMTRRPQTTYFLISTTESVLWRTSGTSAYQLQETMLNSDKIWWLTVFSNKHCKRPSLIDNSSLFW